ncbi:complex I 24 kDa subunit family protein [Chthonomonas calidirosea]|uniref:NADH-quinone oxidoreductase subunit NuoE family protein n=1 Tax=Chthonomonas calidirosea TaxID=454171 RepID=UPI0006ECCCCF|nr:NAD(P)H-dependent oxidoreductase subunit E [Chthonomonas calidirosea]CEK18833.1 NADH-quinone oxidoreductase, E subunit [Chthonomonas calidirosea]
MSANNNRLGGGGHAPREEEPVFEKRFSPEALAELEEIASHYPERKAACLPALWIAQREYGGHLTPSAIKEVAELLDMPCVEVEGVASFYTMYNLRPRGRHHIEVCTCLTCAVCGAYDVVHALEHELGIRVGETTEDGEFTLSEVECLNYCAGAVVAQIGDRYFTQLTPKQVPDLLAMLRDTSNYTPEKLADSIVKLHIPGSSQKRGGSWRVEEVPPSQTSEVE